MLGYSPDEMLHHPAWDFIVEGTASRASIERQLAGSTPAVHSVERTFRRKDRTTINVLINNRTLRNEGGAIVGIRSTLQDITPLKKTEADLRLMGQTVASVRDCISITDLDNRFIFVNEAFHKTYGYTTEELLGKDVAMLRSPNAPPTVTTTIFEETMGGGWHGEVLNRRKDGSDFSVELWTSVVKDDAGTPVAMVGVARDITRRKAAEELLRRNDEQLRLIAENVAEMIAVIDLDGRRVYNSPSYRSILGNPESLKSTDSLQDVHPEDREAVKRVFEETVRTGIGQRLEYRFLLKDGSIRSIDSKGSVIRDKNGKVSQVIVVSRDVTEEKRLAAQFLRAQRMESIGTLAGRHSTRSQQRAFADPHVDRDPEGQDTRSGGIEDPEYDRDIGKTGRGYRQAGAGIRSGRGRRTHSRPAQTRHHGSRQDRRRDLSKINNDHDRPAAGSLDGFR